MKKPPFLKYYYSLSNYNESLLYSYIIHLMEGRAAKAEKELEERLEDVEDELRKKMTLDVFNQMKRTVYTRIKTIENNLPLSEGTIRKYLKLLEKKQYLFFYNRLNDKRQFKGIELVLRNKEPKGYFLMVFLDDIREFGIHTALVKAAFLRHYLYLNCPDKPFYLSYSKIKEYTKLTTLTIQKSIKTLVDKNIIEICDKKKGSRTKYKLTSIFNISTIFTLDSNYFKKLRESLLFLMEGVFILINGYVEYGFEDSSLVEGFLEIKNKVLQKLYKDFDEPYYDLYLDKYIDEIINVCKSLISNVKAKTFLKRNNKKYYEYVYLVRKNLKELTSVHKDIRKSLSIENLDIIPTRSPLAKKNSYSTNKLKSNTECKSLAPVSKSATKSKKKNLVRRRKRLNSLSNDDKNLEERIKNRGKRFKEKTENSSSDSNTKIKLDPKNVTVEALKANRGLIPGSKTFKEAIYNDDVLDLWGYWHSLKGLRRSVNMKTKVFEGNFIALHQILKGKHPNLKGKKFTKDQIKKAIFNLWRVVTDDNIYHPRKKNLKSCSISDFICSYSTGFCWLEKFIDEQGIIYKGDPIYRQAIRKQYCRFILGYEDAEVPNGYDFYFDKAAVRLKKTIKQLDSRMSPPFRHKPPIEHAEWLFEAMQHRAKSREDLRRRFNIMWLDRDRTYKEILVSYLVDQVVIVADGLKILGVNCYSL